jgi:hypothetical protein
VLDEDRTDPPRKLLRIHHRNGSRVEPIQLGEALMNGAEHLGGDLADGVGGPQELLDQAVGEFAQRGQLVPGASSEVLLNGPGAALPRRSGQVAVFGQIRQAIFDRRLLQQHPVFGGQPIGHLACRKITHQAGGSAGEHPHDRQVLTGFGTGGVPQRGQAKLIGCPQVHCRSLR